MIEALTSTESAAAVDSVVRSPIAKERSSVQVGLQGAPPGGRREETLR